RLTQDKRTQMARSLSSFLKERSGVDIKHSHANQAIARLFGFNEHSLTAAIRAGAPVEVELGGAVDDGGGARSQACSVPGCDKPASVQVRLYDAYFEDGTIFDEEDVTCPRLCVEHLLENEEKAKGERRPRGSVRYPYSNQRLAQGFTVYRIL